MTWIEAPPRPIRMLSNKAVDRAAKRARRLLRCHYGLMLAGIIDAYHDKLKADITEAEVVYWIAMVENRNGVGNPERLRDVLLEAIDRCTVEHPQMPKEDVRAAVNMALKSL